MWYVCDVLYSVFYVRVSCLAWICCLEEVYIYYRFIVRFPIGLDFFFITFTILLHLLLSWTSSLSISSSAISTSTLSNHIFLGLPTLYSIHFFIQSSSPFLIMHLLSLGLLLQEAITKYCAHLHRTLAALKGYFPASLVAPLPNSEQINHPFSNHTYTKSTPNHIYHHYAPFVTLTYTTHIISSTAPTYTPHYHPWICEQTPPE